MFTFSAEKATQAAAFLLGKSKGSMNYLKLIKLLYFAERTYLLRFDSLIVGDKFFSLKLGPILSNTLNLIKGKDHNDYWSRHMALSGQHDLACLRDPGSDNLCAAELGVLEETWEQFKAVKPFDLAEISHRECPEWKDPGPRRKAIKIADILRANGRSDSEIAEIEKEQQEYQDVISMLK